MNQPAHFDTRAVHAGQEPDPLTGAVVAPIYATSTYKQDGVGGLRNGYEYSRAGNPTRTALEAALASIENGAAAISFASGLSATDGAIRAICRPGDHVLLPGDAYGGTFRLFSKVAARWGLEISAVDMSDLDRVRGALRDNTRLVWCETPTNPLLNLADISAIAELAHAAGALFSVDNTFATPYLQNPLDLGADLVMHSTTKYIGGHSDVIGGALVVNDAELAESIRFVQFAVGAVPGPFDAFLVSRGIRTLGVRMERHCDNAEQVAAMLQDHPAVSEVFYPGLPDHPGHALARKQMRRAGGMVSFRVRGGEAAATEVCARTEIFTLAESLGGVESLIEHPAQMTHASVRGTELEVPADLVRISVGIESADDLVRDLDQALRT
jgi:cystathionine gamma-synthase